MISLHLRLALESHYLLGQIRQAQPLMGGYWNEVLRLDCSQGRFVLRISHPTTVPEVHRPTF